MTHPQASLRTAPAPPKDRTMLGIGLMTLGFVCYSISDTSAKFLTGELPPIQVAWFRQLGLLAVAIWLLARYGTRHLVTQKPVLQLSRGFVAAISSTSFIFAVHFVPLADAVAVSFIAPFIVTVLGALILREPVGMRRWLAVAIGLVGTVIVIRPGLGVFHPAMLLVFAAASMFAARQILSRLIGTADSTITTIAYSAITSVALLSLPLVLVWETPTGGRTIAILFLLALAAAVGEVLIIRALELTAAVTLAPLQYSMILWSTSLGWLVFSQLPDRWTLIGAAIIMASGLYTLHRERLAVRRRAALAAAAEVDLPR